MNIFRIILDFNFFDLALDYKTHVTEGETNEMLHDDPVVGVTIESQTFLIIKSAASYSFVELRELVKVKALQVALLFRQRGLLLS